MTSGSDLLLFLLPGDRLAKHRCSDKTMEKFLDPLERSPLGARGAAQNCTFKLNIQSGLRLKSKPVLSCVTGSSQTYDRQEKSAFADNKLYVPVNTMLKHGRAASRQPEQPARAMSRIAPASLCWPTCLTPPWTGTGRPSQCHPPHPQDSCGRESV